ncbi:hypothetical protein [Kitasatospora indigofera]|uniref:hypothetical protein n=1 Tax=Kitasatospora indigofera TaxID=67307 RepID=UPI0033A0B625
MDRFDLLVPGEEPARSVVLALGARGHQEVAVQEARLVYPDQASEAGRRVDGWWHVISFADDEGLASGGHYGWERVAVNTVARTFGGYGVGYGTGYPEAGAVPVGPTALVREVDPATARELRRQIVAQFPSPQEDAEPQPPLAVADTGRFLPPLQNSVYAAARELHERGAAGSDVLDEWLTAPTLPDDDPDVLLDLAHSVMYDGACDADSALHVPLLAAVALRRDVSSACRARLITLLTGAATLADRRAAAAADRLAAHGLVAAETPDEAAPRLAVEAVAPSLLAAWAGGDEALRFALAGLAAATRAADCTDRIRALTGARPDGPCRDALLLAAALSQDAAAEIDHAVAHVVQRGRLQSLDLPSPLASPRAAALDLLLPLLESEAGRLPV